MTTSSAQTRHRGTVTRSSRKSPPLRTATRPARSGRRRDEKVHAAILAAADKLLREEGYAAVSIEGIAAKAGVSKQSIYRRWRSLGALLLELYMQGMTFDGPEPTAAFDYKKQLTALLQLTVTRLRNRGYVEILRSVMIEIQTNMATREAYNELVAKPRNAAVRAVFQRAVKEGHLRKDTDIDLAIELFFSVIWLRVLFRNAKFSDTFALEVVDVISRAYGS
jgi:AcrR family transcriptional regulator